METSVMTSKGQLLIPRRLRKKYAIEAGKKVAFIESKEGLVIKPVDETFVNRFVGMFKDALPTTDEYKILKREEIALEKAKEDRLFKRGKK